MSKNIKSRLKRQSPIHCAWALACSMTSIDQRRNNISLFNVIEELTLPGAVFSNKPKPISLEHEIVSQWRRVLNTHVDNREIIIDVAFELFDPNETVVQRLLAQYAIPAGRRRVRVCIGSNAFFVTKPGDYVYRISSKLIDEEEFIKVYEIPFEVKAKIAPSLASKKQQNRK